MQVLLGVCCVAAGTSAQLCDPVRLSSRAAVKGASCRCNETYCDEVAPVGSVPPSGFVLYTTSLGNDLERLSRTTGSFRSSSSSSSSAYSVTVNSSARYQSITGA